MGTQADGFVAPTGVSSFAMQTTTAHADVRTRSGALMRRLLLALTLLVGGAALSGCGPDANDVAGTTSNASPSEGTSTAGDASTSEVEASGDVDADASTRDAAEPTTEDASAGPEPADEQESGDAARSENASVPEGPYLVVPPLTDTPQTTFDGAEEVLEPDADYAARIVTSKGPIIVELYEDRVPNTVNNFVFLALHRFYDGVPFHRVLEDFMAQTGDPTGTGRGGPGYRFEDEIDPELTHDGKGVLSMANAGPNTNGSQFFITFTATPWLDGKHAVFGKVVEGLDVLDELTRIDPGRPAGKTPDTIEKVEIQAA